MMTTGLVREVTQPNILLGLGPPCPAAGAEAPRGRPGRGALSGATPHPPPFKIFSTLPSAIHVMLYPCAPV